MVSVELCEQRRVKMKKKKKKKKKIYPALRVHVCFTGGGGVVCVIFVFVNRQS